MNADVQKKRFRPQFPENTQACTHCHGKKNCLNGRIEAELASCAHCLEKAEDKQARIVTCAYCHGLGYREIPTQGNGTNSPKKRVPNRNERR